MALRGLGARPGWASQKGALGHTHLLVIEAWPISVIKSKQAVLFFLDIIHRFGVPNSIMTDNGKQFTGKKFIRFCDEQHIRVDWAAVTHPRTNGQVECANDMLLQGLKPRIFNRLNKFSARWVAELPAVL